MNHVCYFFIISALLSFYYANSQTLEANYECNYNGSFKMEELIVNNNSAIIKISKANAIGGIKSNFSSNESVRNIALPAMTYYKDTNSDNVFMQIGDESKNNFIIDSIPKFNWRIDNDNVKFINDFKCVYATVNFRGTELYAYFTAEIPVPFGPWKFKDLPGLIMEIGSLDNVFKWSIVNVDYPASKSYDTTVPDLMVNNSKTLRSVVQSSKNDLNNRLKRSDSRLPKGVVVSSTTVKRNGVEQIFEWELEESEKN